MKIKMCDEFFYCVRTLEEDKIKSLNADFGNVFRNNNKLKLYKGEWVKIKVKDYVIHHVRPTETLINVAKKYNSNKEKLIKDNHLTCEKLFIGQELRIYRND